MYKKVQDYAIFDALISGSTVKQTAAVVGVSEKTVRRLLSNPVFADELMKARQDISRSVLQRIVATGDKAISTIISIMDNEKASSHARVQAAKIVIDNLPEALEKTEILDSMKKIEERLKLYEQ